MTVVFGPLSLPRKPSSTAKNHVSPSAKKPAEGSLCHALRKNAGTSLFVPLIRWTSLHSQLLGVKFMELPPCSTPIPATPPGSQPHEGHTRPSETINKLIGFLDVLSSPTAEYWSSVTAVQTLLETLWPGVLGRALFRSNLPIYFGDRMYADQIRPHIMWNRPMHDSASFKPTSTELASSLNNAARARLGPAHPSGQSDLPMLCYMSQSKLKEARRASSSTQLGQEGRENEPVRRLNKLRAKRLIPANSDQDPLLVGIFLAMAQRHFYGMAPLSSRGDSRWSAGQSKPPRPKFKDVKLKLLTYDNKTQEFLVYTSLVTAGFLERFHKPNRGPRGDEEGTSPNIEIEYTRVPIWPLLGLRERLGNALGEDMVGSFDVEDIRTWLDEEKGGVTGSKRSISPVPFSERPRKRKRIEGQAVNTHLDEDTKSHKVKMLGCRPHAIFRDITRLPSTDLVSAQRATCRGGSTKPWIQIPIRTVV